MSAKQDEARARAREWVAQKMHEHGMSKGSEDAMKRAREIADKADKQNDSKKKGK